MESKLLYIYTNSLEYDPLVNVDFTETYEGEGTGENQGNSNSKSSGKNENLTIVDDTPQTNIKKQNLDNGFYASEVSQSENENTVEDETKTTSTTESKQSYVKKLKGNQGISSTYQALIKQFRENIRAVDEEIIYSLNDLFFGLY